MGASGSISSKISDAKSVATERSIRYCMNSDGQNSCHLDKITSSLKLFSNIKGQQDTQTDKEILSSIVSFCEDNTFNQDALKVHVRDIMGLIQSSAAVEESLLTITYLCRCTGKRKLNSNSTDDNLLCESTYNTAIIEELGKCGACERVIIILKEFISSNEGVSELGCWIICYLSLLDSNRETLGRGGACEVVVNLVRKYGNKHIEIMEAGLWAIYRLAYRNDANKSLLGTLRTCEIVVETLKMYGKESVLVAQAGCLAMSNLASDNKINNEMLGEYGACETVLEILKTHGLSNINVAEAGCLAVCNLAFIQSNRDRLGICTIAMEILLKYKDINSIIANCEDIIHLLQ